jgi:Coenzyme PQQ synthesis protein D (PqqD)
MARTSNLRSATIVQRAKDVPFSQLDDELLAIDAQAGYVYSLNESAGRVWELIQSPTSVGEVCNQLRREFTIDETTCQREVIALLEGLCDAGLVQVDQAAAR